MPIRATWHRLRVHSSPEIAPHSQVQDLFFGADLLLRRHDCSVDVAAQRVYDEAGGIRFPTKPRAFLRGTDDGVVEYPLLVSINLSSVLFM